MPPIRTRFQSTLSMRRATFTQVQLTPTTTFQSTLSMRRATRYQYPRSHPYRFQSTLSMRRATCYPYCVIECSCLFQSTLSMRRATFAVPVVGHGAHISIHALHEESDGDGSPPFPTGLRFQSTLSMRRATVIVKDRALRAAISIHALHEESDEHLLPRTAGMRDFNPRSP